MSTVPRIDRAQVVSFRLEVPLQALERLPDEVGSLGLDVRSGRDELVVHTVGGRSRLRFKVSAAQAVLAEVQLVDDERGLFFQRVLGPLMVRFKGDLVIRLIWNTAERNSHGEFAEVKVRQGETTYPGLGLMKNMLAPAAALGGGPESLFQEHTEAAADPLTPEEQEVERLLARARDNWGRYQKSKAPSGDDS
jgi:hypothetical protein